MIFFLKRNYDQLRKRKAIISVSFIYGITYIAINNKDILIISTTVGMQVALQWKTVTFFPPKKYNVPIYHLDMKSRL